MRGWDEGDFMVAGFVFGGGDGKVGVQEEC